MSKNEADRRQRESGEAALKPSSVATTKPLSGSAGVAGIGHNKGPPLDPIPPPATYTIPEFCLAHRISRTALYGAWGAGIGPRRIQIGTGRSSKVLISVEAAADWRAEREAATKQKAA
jgi:hypothetical protein